MNELEKITTEINRDTPKSHTKITSLDSQFGPPEEIQDKHAQNTKRIRHAITFLVGVQMVLYAGAFFAYGPMQLLLEKDGAFTSVCDSSQEKKSSDTTECSALCCKQSATLVTVHFIGVICTNVSAPFVGYISDKYGPLVLSRCLTSTCWCGLIFILIASQTGRSYLLFPGFSMLGIMASCSSVMIMATANIFRWRKTQRQVISLLNALFDAGGATYLIIWQIGESLNASFSNLMVVYLIIAIALLFVLTYLWKVLEDKKHSRRRSSNQSKKNQKCAPPQQTVGDVIIEPGDKDYRIVFENSERQESDIDSIHREQEHVMVISLDDDEENSLDDIGLSLEGRKTKSVPEEDNNQSSNHSKRELEVSSEAISASGYIPISQRSECQQACSSQYVVLCIFFSFHYLKNVYTLTTARNFLGDLGDDEMSNKYLSAFMLLTSISIVGLPCIEFVISKYGYHAGIQCINLLALAHGIVQISTRNLNIQVIGFVIFVMYRAFIFAVSFSFLSTFVSGAVVGKLTGLMLGAAGIFSLCNIPLGTWPIENSDSNNPFFYPHLILTVMVFPCILLGEYLGRGIRREKAATCESIQD